MPITRLISFLAIVVLAGCGPGSIHPFIAETDHQFDSRLEGTWRDPEGTEAAVITRDSSGLYLILYTEEDGQTGRYYGSLGRIGNHRVLDVHPDVEGLGATETQKALLVPLHIAIFIDSIGSEIRFRSVEPDSLRRYLEREPGAVAHILNDDLLVLTAPTPELQRFVAGLVSRRGVFQEATTWVRASGK